MIRGQLANPESMLNLGLVVWGRLFPARRLRIPSYRALQKFRPIGTPITWFDTQIGVLDIGGHFWALNEYLMR